MPGFSLLRIRRRPSPRLR